MLKPKNNLLLRAVILGSLFLGNSISAEKEERNNKGKPNVHPVDSRKKLLFERKEQKPQMEKAPPLSEPQTLKSVFALRRLLWEAKSLSQRGRPLIKLGELTLDIPKKFHEETAAECTNNDHISALYIPSYLIVRNFIQDSTGLKTTVRRDLKESSIAEIHNWLGRIAQSSTSRGKDTPYNVLSIHNATQEQADEILKIPTISHLGGIRIWLLPTTPEAVLLKPEVSTQPAPASIKEKGDKKDEKTGVAKKEEDAAHYSAGGSKKTVLPKREEKKPRMDRGSALSQPRTLKSTNDLWGLLWTARDLSRQEGQLIKLGELTLDVPKEDYKKAISWCTNNKYISTLRIPAYLIMQNFFTQNSTGLKTTVRRDLKEDSIAGIHNWLDRIAQSPTSREEDTSYNVLSIRNVTQEQADEILNIPTISHLGGIRIWLLPMPSPAEPPPLNEGEDKKDAPIIGEQEELNVKSDSGVSLQSAVTKDGEVAHHFAFEEDQKDVKDKSDAFTLADFEEHRRDLSDQPLTQEQSDRIHDNKKVDIEALFLDPIPVGLLPELKDKEEKAETAEIIEKKDMEQLARDLHQNRFKPTLIEITQRFAHNLHQSRFKPTLMEITQRFAHNLHQSRFTSILMEIAKRKVALHRRLLSQPYLFDLRVASVYMVLNLLRKAHKYSEKDNPIQVPLSLHNITKRQLDNILADENADYIENLEWTYEEGEENNEDVGSLDEELYLQFSGDSLPKKREAPPIEEQVFGEPEEKQNIETDDAEKDKEDSKGDKEKPIVLNWEKTTIKNIKSDALGFMKTGIEVERPQDLVPSSKVEAYRVPENWVRIYCRG